MVAPRSITFNGETRSRREWQRHLGLCVNAISKRLNAGWTIAEALTPPRHFEWHGYTGTPEYKCWDALKDRRCNPSNKNYADYGGRGISVCDRWRYSFINFLDDMGKRPSSGHSIDRKDVNGNYAPNNCRWATRSTQMFNRRPYKHKKNR